MATNAFLKKKWERVFYTFFDTNQNKVIDWNDFELLFEKIKELRGPDSKEYRIVSEAMGIVWDGLLSGTQRTLKKDDAEVSIDDWNRIWSRFDPKQMPIWQWEYLKYMFFLIDTSGDKLIDKTEFTEVMQIFGMSEADAAISFDKIAVDDKGEAIEKIDYGQFADLWRDYFSSTDPNRPGSWLFGPW
uniref:EF-hand domain-containing protein n=1 Tax=Plectus sambesii TaxID=2011161 RepID=A0A914WYC8_9BILA